MSFSSAAPSGYLDFTNATPKAIKMIATSNIGVGTTVPAYALDVHGSANVGALHMTLPVTDIASNLVTYDKNTGQLFDSGGLFSNKLTVVSPHPPSAMSSDTTVITDHGTYVSAASSSATDVYAWQAFNETTSSYWETPPSYMGASNVYNGGSTQLASSTELGEWLTIEVPNEMTLRHIEVTPRTIASYPGSANLYATNDSVTWTEVKNWENVVPTNTSSQQIAVNATSAYKKYGMVTTKVSGNSSNLAIANLKLFGESLTFDNGHLSVTGLPMATVASNLVTYDKTTGKFFDSAGLFSNKLAVVSVQPPEALTGASTVVTGHGTYTIESPGVDAYKLFDKDDTTTWTGENVTVNLPYKTTLRYLKMMADTLSGTVTVEASHTDGLTWTTLVSGATIAETVLVNATQPYKKYKFSFGSSITLKTLDLFTESFSIDGGKVAMAQQPTTGGETTMNQHGPHGRLPKAVPLKKYPEIAFDPSKLRGNDSTNTYTQAGYTVTASSHENQILRSRGLTGDQGYTMNTSGPDFFNADGGNGIKGMQQRAQGKLTPRGRPAEIPSGQNPKSPAGALTPTGTRSYWADLGGDMFDEWGQWYIFNPADQTASHIQFSAVNGTTGTVYTDPQIHHGKTFIVKHGWVAKGIFKLDVECEDPTFSFSIGMYGNMGSDTDTENVDKQYAAPWGTLNYNFNRTNATVLADTDPVYTYLIPKQRSFNDATTTSGTNFTSKLNTSAAGASGDDLAIWFDTLQMGATMYFVIGASGNITSSAMSDWVANDITGEQSAWHVFDEITPESSWSSKSGTYYDGTSPANSYTGTTHQLGTGTAYGEWLKVKLSHRIKVTKFILYADDINEAPKSYKIYGSVTGSSWTELKDVSNETPSIYGNSHEITDTEGYRYIAIVVTQVNSDQGNVRIGEIKLYGYENFEGGDTSVDTTFTSIMNTPQISGVEVYVDGSLGETFTNRVVGPTVSNTHTTYVSAEKYWELSGNVESNVTLEANTFLSGDAPHSLSMWFNSSNLVSNVSNSCIFSLGTEERLDHVSVAFSNNYQTVQKLLPRDLEANDRFGFAVAMNSDGTKFIVSAYEEHAGDNADAGAAYIFTYNSDTGNWDERKLVSPDIEAAAKFGISVGMNSDGTKVIVGAFEEHADNVDNAGAAYIFTYSNGSWDFGTKIVAPDKAANDKFGYSAAMSGDGNRVIVGAYIENHNVAGGVELSSAGSAYIYTYDGSSWDTGTKIVASDRAASDIFGRSVAINSDGTKAIVGASSGNAAYIFTYNSGTSNWDEQEILVASDGAAGDEFGYSVAMNSGGTKVIVGAYVEDPGGTNAAGAAYIYTYDGSNWDTGTKIVAPDKEVSARFGICVEMNSDGTKVIVGAYLDDANGVTDAGAAYIFTYDGSNWDTGLKISAPDKSASDQLSSDKQGVAMSDDGARVIVGVQLDDVFSANSGAVYVYDRDTTHHLTTDLKLQSNTWHNLTYAYQGEGGSQVTYLDGRKVAEDQAEDTFGDYPPFAMTGHSQGGYVVSASSELAHANSYKAYQAFDDIVTGNNALWLSDNFYGTNGVYTGSESTTVSGTVYSGEWLQIELPHKLKVNYVAIRAQNDALERSPLNGVIAGSNDGTTWYELNAFTGITTSSSPAWSATLTTDFMINSTNAYKYFRFVATSLQSTTTYFAAIQNVQLYGHKEGDLVRLPDPTNVLKYPHIAMRAPAQRGYVASASDFNLSYPPWQAFDDRYTDVSSAHGLMRWQPNGIINSIGRYTNPGDGPWFPTSSRTDTTTLASGSSPASYTGDWLQLESPNKLNIKSYRLYNSTDYVTSYNAHTVVLLGSNTGNNDWVDIGSGETVLSWSPAQQPGSYVSTAAIVSTSGNTGFYKYHRLIVRKVTDQHIPVIYQVQLYGTEEATSVPIQIGGGNIDKVANFRVYDKFIGEDQALEIWDAQKDTFRGVKNSVTLHKGRLGIGTTEPQGRLAVADEPDPTTYGLQEFPPKPLVGYKTHIEGHGVFCVSSSSVYQNSTSVYLPYMAFGKKFDTSTSFNQQTWNSGVTYTASTGEYPATASGKLGSFRGEWLLLELPYKIKLVKFSLSILDDWAINAPRDFVVAAYDEDTTEWVELASYVEEVWPNPVLGTREIIKNKSINSTSYYKQYALVTSKIGTGTTNLNMAEWRLFGNREQVTKQSVLHDGQLTLTKNLTVPRIGPALDADDTPRRDRLVVEYNTSTNPTFERAVRDTSGRGNDGVFYDGASYDAREKALDFDGTNDYVRRETLPGFKGGNITYGVSMWIKLKRFGDANGSAVAYIYTIGNVSAAGQKTFVYCRQQNTGENPTYQLLLAGYSYDFPINKNDWALNTWYHIVTGYDGTTFNGTNLQVYVDGVSVGTLTDNASGGGDAGAQLNIAENPRLTLGKNDTEHFSGYISNFKLYDTVLTAEEVKTLYQMGRCDEGHHVVNFSKTRVGIGLGDGEAPRSALDVRDLIYARTTTIGTFTGQHICFPDESMEKGLIVSAKKNKFVKLNGLATGKSAITVDESLPIVSLSNVAQDKACFGVVSKMEESNEAYRTEITGGLVSESVKIAGDNRAIVNSVGEGAIWVVDTGGSLESGDYITTSNVAGYGQKQDDDILHNYTVAKITMDCDFTGSNVAVQTIKREETGLQTIMEDNWNQLVDYDRSSNTETQYSNTLVSSAYSDEPGYTPREVTTIVDYTDGSNIVSIAEWSNLESNIQNTYQSNTFTEIVDYTKFVSFSEWSNLTTDVQNTYSEAEITTYYQIQRGENVLDENGQLQFEDKTGATEAPYERRFLDASGAQTDEANAVHIAAFVGCTYHCG